MTSETEQFGSRRKLLSGATLVAAGTAATTLMTKPTAAQSVSGRFAGKVVAITGGNSGIGEACMRAFAKEGAKVMFCARRDELGRKVEREVKAAGGDVTWMRTDVREHAQVKAFIDATITRYGRLDVLFNNAGIFMTPGEVQDITTENYLDIMLTNAGGAFFGMKYAVPQMRRQGSGVIVNNASVAGHMGFPNTAAYNASKHAIIGMTKAVAKANGKHNIRVNSISPLAVDTPQLRESFEFQKITYEQVAPNFVTPRIMDVKEMASAVMFLASDQATSMTGMDLDVTGGHMA
ncbi:MAG: short-chain dehydrogenase [Methylobacterium sp.]|nr:MAG: short-chain dehydrogenase [Methylobacterium sp.]